MKMKINAAAAAEVIVTALLIVAVLSPISNMLFAPSFNGGTASGQAYWIPKAVWGFYPFTFAVLMNECSYPCGYQQNCAPACFDSFKYVVYGITQDNWSSGVIDSGFFVARDSENALFYENFAVNFVLALAASTAALLAYSKIRKTGKKKK